MMEYCKKQGFAVLSIEKQRKFSGKVPQPTQYFSVRYFLNAG